MSGLSDIKGIAHWQLRLRLCFKAKVECGEIEMGLYTFNNTSPQEFVSRPSLGIKIYTKWCQNCTWPVLILQQLVCHLWNGNYWLRTQYHTVFPRKCWQQKNLYKLDIVKFGQMIFLFPLLCVSYMCACFHVCAHTCVDTYTSCGVLRLMSE